VEPESHGQAEICASWCAPGGPKECGIDGCGGSCGQCEHIPACYEAIECKEPEGDCEHGALKEDYCLIGGECYVAGATKEGSECLRCLPEMNDSGWSAALGEPCGSEGFVCDAAAICCDRATHCADRQCGSDGCDGVCGLCEEPTSYCNLSLGVCQEPECEDPGPDLWDGCQDGKIVEFQVNSQWQGDQQEPDIVALPQGYAVVWQGDNQAGSEDESHTEIYGRVFDQDGVAGNEFQANAIEEGRQGNPSVATVGNRLIVAWESDSPTFTSSQLMFRLFVLEEPLMEVEQELSAGLWDQRPKEVDTAACGLRYLFVWQEPGVNSSHDVHGNSLTITAEAPATEYLMDAAFGLNIQKEGSQQRPTAAFFSDCSFVTAWDGDETGEDKEMQGSGIFMRLFNADGTPRCPGEGECQEQKVNSVQDGDQRNPALTVDENDHFVIGWQSVAGSMENDGIFYRRFDSNKTPKEAERQIKPGAGGEYQRPALAPVAFDTGGSFFGTELVWQNGTADISGKVISPDGTSSSGFNAKMLDLFDSVQQVGLPVTALLADGSFVVIWQSQNQDGDGWGIYGRRYAIENEHVVSRRSATQE